jgi:hypothetical protein
MVSVRVAYFRLCRYQLFPKGSVPSSVSFTSYMSLTTFLAIQREFRHLTFVTGRYPLRIPALDLGYLFLTGYNTER